MDSNRIEQQPGAWRALELEQNILNTEDVQRIRLARQNSLVSAFAMLELDT
jgi:hypothetical protein